jgi:hypothetical protein
VTFSPNWEVSSSCEDIFHAVFLSMAQLTLNLIQGAVSLNFSPEVAQALKEEIDELIVGLKGLWNILT